MVFPPIRQEELMDEKHRHMILLSCTLQNIQSNFSGSMQMQFQERARAAYDFTSMTSQLTSSLAEVLSSYSSPSSSPSSPLVIDTDLVCTHLPEGGTFAPTALIDVRRFMDLTQRDRVTEISQAIARLREEVKAARWDVDATTVVVKGCNSCGGEMVEFARSASNNLKERNGVITGKVIRLIVYWSKPQVQGSASTFNVRDHIRFRTHVQSPTGGT